MAHDRFGGCMPVVAIVDGVKIAFYSNEHPPAHFHETIAEHRAVIDIVALTIAAGSLPAAKRGKVLAWAASRQGLLLHRFAAAIAREKVEPIE
ncbi:MAG: DUF4160 domain-containing protein [Roseiarcus sp.]